MLGFHSVLSNTKENLVRHDAGLQNIFRRKEPIPANGTARRSIVALVTSEWRFLRCISLDHSDLPISAGLSLFSVNGWSSVPYGPLTPP